MPATALHRRRFLAIAGASAVAAATASAGCSALAAGRRHEKDAPIATGVDSGPWPTSFRDARHRSHAPDLAGPAPDAPVRAVARTGRFMGGAVAVGPARLYYGAEQMPPAQGEGEDWSGFRAIERRTGEEAWRVPVEKGMAGPTVHRNAIFATEAGRTRALDRRDGSFCWSYPVGTGHDLAGPVVDGGTVYVPGVDHLLALDARTGERRWRGDEVDGAVMGVAPARGRVCITTGGGDDGALVAYDPATGEEAWRFDPVGESYAPPAVDDERAYVMNTSGAFYAVSLADGGEQWRFDYRRSSYVPPAVGDGVVYLVGTNPDVLHAFDAATGEERWRFGTGVGANTAPAVLDDTVYVASDATLHAIDAATGEPRWQRDLGVEVRGQLSAGDGVLYFESSSDDLETDPDRRNQVVAVGGPAT